MKSITLEVTNRCNLCCRICNIWKERTCRDLSLKKIKELIGSLSGPLSVALTGGEPFLHPQIDGIYRYLFKLHLQKKVKNINIATNAYSEDILRFVERNKRYLRPLAFSISLDGLEKKHNLHRGKNDAFKKTAKNIFLIKKHNLPLSLKFVISKINYRDLLDVYKLSKQMGCVFYPKLFEKVENYYHRTNKLPSLMLEAGMLSFVEKNIKKIYTLENKNNKEKLTSFSSLCIIKFINNKNLDFIKACSTPDSSLFVTSGGDIYSCLYQEKVGNIKTWPNFDRKRFERISQDAQRGKCPKCLSYHGFLRDFNSA